MHDVGWAEVAVVAKTGVCVCLSVHCKGISLCVCMRMHVLTSTGGSCKKLSE